MKKGTLLSMENNQITFETDEITRILVTPEEKAEEVINLVKDAVRYYDTNAVTSLDMLVAAKKIINNMLRGLHDKFETPRNTPPRVKITDDGEFLPCPEVITAKERIVKAVEAAVADTVNSDNCIADYHFSVVAADKDGKDVTTFSIVFDN